MCKKHHFRWIFVENPARALHIEISPQGVTDNRESWGRSQFLCYITTRSLIGNKKQLIHVNCFTILYIEPLNGRYQLNNYVLCCDNAVVKGAVCGI